MTNTPRSALALLLLGGFLLAAQAHAGPPFLTDDPEPVELHHWEVYLATLDARTAGGWAGTAPHIEVNYGAAPNLQLHVIAPFAYDAPRDEGSHNGFGDLELGFKFRFLEETPTTPQLAIFPLLECSTGSARENLGNGGTQIFIPVWAQKSWGKWTVYGGGGYGINSGAGNQDWGLVGAVLQRKVLDKLLVGAEVYHQTAKVVGDRSDTAFNIGAVYDLSENHHLLFSAGRSISGPTDFQCYAAYQWTFEFNLLHAFSHSSH